LRDVACYLIGASTSAGAFTLNRMMAGLLVSLDAFSRADAAKIEV
jgi:hypothetical protein